MLDRPYVGQRTHDVLRVLDWLAASGTRGPPGRQGLGRAAGHVRRAALDRGRAGDAQERPDLLPGDRRIEGLRLAAVGAPAGRAAAFDLPDCYRALAEKKLRQIEPWGPDAKP